jgi:hypothetical protein
MGERFLISGFCASRFYSRARRLAKHNAIRKPIYFAADDISLLPFRVESTIFRKNVR